MAKKTSFSSPPEMMESAGSFVAVPEAAPNRAFPGRGGNVRYDAAPNQIYVGYGEGTLGVLDAGERRETRRHCAPRPSRIIPVGGIRTTSVHELDQFLLVVSLVTKWSFILLAEH